MPSRNLVLLIAAAAACGHGGDPPPPSGRAVPIATSAVHTEPLAELYRASGTVRGRSTVVITSKLAGYVRDVHVRPGDQVTAGQVLLEIEANDARAGVGRQRAEVVHAMESRAEAQSAVEAARVAADLAKTERDRSARLLAQDAVARSVFDQDDARARGAQAQLAAAEARLRAASSGIDIARESLAEGQATLDYARVTAPFAGRIVERRVDPGALASPAMPLLVLDDGASLRVEAAVEESRATSIKIGDPADVELAGQVVTGKVGEIVPSVDVASRAFVVKVDLPASITGLQPGTFARVGFREGTRPHLVVPASAVTTLGALDRVYVVAGGLARVRMVTLGETQGPWTEVLSGLAAGELIATQPAALHDGEAVEGSR